MPQRTTKTAELDARVKRLGLDIVEWGKDQRIALAAKTALWNIHRND